MQAFRITDALRCILFNAPRGPNLACTRESLLGTGYPSNIRFWRETFSQSRHRLTTVSWEGMHLGGLASAHIRNSGKLWEIDRLYLGEGVVPALYLAPGGDSLAARTVTELLGGLILLATERSAQRILLRLAADSPLMPAAQRAGFFPCFRESLLTGALTVVSSDKLAPPLQEPSARAPQDDFSLFQLYSATTPAPVRDALALTFDQWQELQEPLCRRGQEWVIQVDGRLVGWMSLSPVSQGIIGRATVHPEHPKAVESFLELASAQPGAHHWLVPDYLTHVASALQHRGLQPVAGYDVLAASVAARVLQRGMAPVEA